MLKKIGIPALALIGALSFVPAKANARSHFGVWIGAPAYGYPYAYPYGYTYGPPVYGHGWVGHHGHVHWR